MSSEEIMIQAGEIVRAMVKQGLIVKAEDVPKAIAEVKAALAS